MPFRSLHTRTRKLPSSALIPKSQMQLRSTELRIRSSHDENWSAGGVHVSISPTRQQNRYLSEYLWVEIYKSHYNGSNQVLTLGGKTSNCSLKSLFDLVTLKNVSVGVGV